MDKNKFIINLLSTHGIRPSLQRIKIMEYLLTHKNHPNVEMIYRDLNKEIPTLSKTTIYNTLKLFADKGVVLTINIEDNELRYDGDTSIHGHFKCQKCGQIFDFKVGLKELKLEGIDEFLIKEHHIYLKGLCKRCKRYMK